MRPIDLRAVLVSCSLLAACGSTQPATEPAPAESASEPVATSGSEAAPAEHTVDEGMVTVEGELAADGEFPALRYALDVPEGAVLSVDQPGQQVWEATINHLVIFIVTRSPRGVAYLARDRARFDIAVTEGEVSWRANDSCGPGTISRTDCSVSVEVVVPTESGPVSCSSNVLLQGATEVRSELRDTLLARCRTIRGR